MDVFLAATDFAEALDEVRSLLLLASVEGRPTAEHSALLKSSILLLATKVEGFLEAAADEARYNLLSRSPQASALPSDLVVAVLQSTIDEAFLMKLRAGNSQAIERLKGISEYIADGPLTSLPLDVRFSYGKHGEKEVRRLFRRLGIVDIFEELTRADNIAGESELRGLLADINSLTAIRNNIIHSDASPSLTVSQVAGFVDRFSRFSVLVVDVLRRHCDALAPVIA